MEQLESEKANSGQIQEEVDQSSELASIGGHSHYDSLLLQSPPNDNSLPVSHDNDFSSLLEEDPGAGVPATEMKQREVAGARKREKQERRMSKKLAKNNRVRFRYEIKLAKMEKQGTGIGSWLSSFFARPENPVKALAHVEHVPEQEGNPRNEYHTTVQAG